MLDAAARKFGIGLAFDEFGWNCDNYDKIGAWMPADWKEQIGGHDCIYFGACGWPARVPDHVSLWDSLIKFRREFDQYVNLRPVRLMPGIKSPLAGRMPGDIDFWMVRENTEGEYSSVGGRMFEGTAREVCVQQATFTRTGTDRILKFAFELAAKRPKKHLTSATKSNGISITMPYWDERVVAMAANFPDVRWDKFHIDILSAHFVLHPDWFDVVVASNLFGDILSDLGPACTGTIGIAPSGNINADRLFPSLFEPVHGSAPDIAGKNVWRIRSVRSGPARCCSIIWAIHTPTTRSSARSRPFSIQSPAPRARRTSAASTVPRMSGGRSRKRSRSPFRCSAGGPRALRPRNESHLKLAT